MRIHYRLMGAAALFAAIATPLSAQAQKGPPTAVLVSGPEPGAKAPDFRLPWATKDSIGSVADDFVLKNMRGKTVVLAFYPADFTSGCTAELKAFTDRYDELFGEGVEVVGISTDSLESHRRFAASLGAPFKLLSDPSQRVARAYGSKGETHARRTVYVIDPSGTITYRDMRFGALDPKAYDALQKAVREARGG
jgi:peroxiredoxin Q/BCP